MCLNILLWGRYLPSFLLETVFQMYLRMMVRRLKRCQRLN